MKPMLACDCDESKLTFPLIAQPKIDGVRAVNNGGTFTGRSLKGFKNHYITKFFGQQVLAGFDGELAADLPTHSDLCRLTTSAVSTIEGQPSLMWYLFDYVTQSPQPYHHRFAILQDKVRAINTEFPELGAHLRTIPSYTIANYDDLIKVDEWFLSQGYEGTIIRAQKGLHKAGRSTVREGGLLRIKRFVEEEAVVIGVTEGESNQNEAKTNQLGHTERSTHQANMVANGMVGNIICTAVKTVKYGDKIVIIPGQQLTVAAGKLTADERRHYFEHQNEIIGKTIKFQFFPHGIKDKPRFPTFQSFRDPSDM